MSRSRRRLPALALFALPFLPFAAGCHVAFGFDHPRVDGVELEESHVETLEASTLPAGFRVDAALGDIRVEAAEGAPTLVVQVFEKTPGDAQAVFVEGKLVSRSQSGEPSAIGDVTLRIDRPLEHLDVSTGMGDVIVRGVVVTGPLSVESGMGDCRVEAAGTPDSIELTAGKGDLRVSDMECDRITAETGLGDIELKDVVATRAKLATGLGDVDVDDSRFESLAASTGLGDVDCRDSEYVESDLSSGLGSVRGR